MCECCYDPALMLLCFLFPVTLVLPMFASVLVSASRPVNVYQCAKTDVHVTVQSALGSINKGTGLEFQECTLMLLMLFHQVPLAPLGQGSMKCYLWSPSGQCCLRTEETSFVVELLLTSALFSLRFRFWRMSKVKLSRLQQ